MKKTLIIILSIVVLLSSAIFLITSNSSVIKKAAKVVSSKYFPELDMNWSSLKIKVDDPLSPNRKYTIEYDDCFKYKNIEACFNELKVAVRINILELELLKLSTLVVDTKFVKVKETKEKSPSTKTNIKESIKMIYSYLDIIKTNVPSTLKLDLNSIELESGNDIIKINSNINNKLVELSCEANNLKITAKLEKENNQFSGPINYLTEDFKIKTSANIKNNESIKITIESKIETKALSKDLSPSLKLNIDENSAIVELQTNTFLYKGITLRPIICRSRVDLDNDENINLNCQDINLNFRDKLPLTASLDLDLAHIFPVENEDPILKLSFKANDLNQKDINFEISTRLSLIQDDNKNRLNIEKFSWILKANRFKTLVDRSKDTAFAIPAPVNTMEGSFVLSSNDLVEINEDDISIPLNADINLVDKTKNSIDLNFKGDFLYSNKRTNKLKGELLIDAIRLNIPNIDPIGGIPNLTSSSRINKKIKLKKKKEKSSLSYDLTIKSKSDNSIKVYYYLLDPYFSFGLNAKLKNDFFEYELYSDNNMTIRYLKRELDFSKIKIKAINENKATIDARFLSYVSSYKLILDVIGTLDSPKLMLSSSPSLPREDIISLLIYKRKASSISTNQRQSVGGTEAAIADKALSLFSIWAFASTPIDYVSYNPASKSYSASISLPGDTNFMIGTDWESINNLTLRKQLSDTWAIETSYNPNEENAKQDVMIQKEINF